MSRPVAIRNIATGQGHVTAHVIRTDIAPGEPGCLHTEHDIAPGEEIIAHIPHGGAVAIVESPKDQGDVA